MDILLQIVILGHFDDISIKLVGQYRFNLKNYEYEQIMNQNLIISTIRL